MEAQAGKLFRTGKALRILLTVFNVVLVIGCVLTAAELLGYRFYCICGMHHHCFYMLYQDDTENVAGQIPVQC